MLTPNSIYHIYNHANGNDNLFKCDENYRFFIGKIQLYLNPIADLYSYCLMPNHFHLLLKIKEQNEVVEFHKALLTNTEIPFPEIEYYKAKLIKLNAMHSFEKDNKMYIAYISKQFSNLFSSYTQSFNKLNSRRGSLFIKNFKNKEINSEEYFKTVVEYIHKNPTHHGFVTNFKNWKWSSYHDFLSDDNSMIKKEKVINWFNGIEGFINAHENLIDLSLIQELE